MEANPLRPRGRTTHNGRVVTMIPVVERRGDECPFWDVEPGESYLEVRSASGGRLGAVAWALVGGTGGIEGARDAGDALEAFVAAGDDQYFAPGGLRVVVDETVIDPGCCAGIEEWRDWAGAVRGQAVGFGHDPDVWVECHGPVLRVWEDPVATGEPGPEARSLDFPADALPGLLLGVRQDLADFLGAAHRWALDVAPAQADAFVAALDRRLEISPAFDF
jgi:hypothetical protein